MAEGAPHNCHGVLIQQNSPGGSGVLNTQRIVDGIRRYGLARRVSLGMGSEVSKVQAFPVGSLCLVVVSQDVSSQLPLQSHARWKHSEP